MAKSKVKKLGVCCLCGQSGELSFEHIPPHAAYNKETVIEYEWEHLTENRTKKGRSLQGGFGKYTLCEKCNNDTGSWYGGEYVKWARNCYFLINIWKIRKITFGTVTLKNVYPLRFLKQVITCFFSNVSAPDTSTFASNNPDLTQFVLDKYNTVLPSGFRFFMCLYSYSADSRTNLRHWGLVGRLPVVWNDKKIISVGRANIFSEIAHPPFQLVMTQRNEVFDGGTEITNFSNYSYDDKVDLAIMMRILNSSSLLPGAG